MANPKPLTWTTKRLKLAKLVPWSKNPRIVTEAKGQQIAASLDEFGLVDPLVANHDEKHLIGGHARRLLLLEKHGPDAEDDVRLPSRQLSPKEAERLSLRLNQNRGEWDWDKLANEFRVPDLVDIGFEEKDFAPMPPPPPPDAADSRREATVTCPKCGEVFKPKRPEK